MNERIRMVREKCKLSRAAFGEKLGVSGDVINNLERGRVEVKESIVKLLCSVYAVDEEWLRTGEGEMHAPKEEDPLDELVKQKNLSRWDQLLIEKFLDLNAGQREAVMKYVLKVVDNYRQLEAQVPAQKSKEKETSIESDSIESEETLYKSSSGYVASADSSALSSTGGMEKTDGAKLA